MWLTHPLEAWVCQSMAMGELVFVCSFSIMLASACELTSALTQSSLTQLLE
jgi:hypothetical protein